MDLYNNTQGAFIGGDSQGSNISTAEIANKVNTALFNGQFKYLNPLDFPNYERGIIPGVTQLIFTNH